MKGCGRSSFQIGMPHLAPEQLSEVELLKLCGDLQWSNMCDLLDCRSHQLQNETGERLYASFISIHLKMGGRGCLAAFQEGDPFHAASAVRFFAQQFLEGAIAFDREEIAAQVLSSPDAIFTAGELASPTVVMTNALVARVSGNMRLKVFRPAGIESKQVPETTARPPGIDEHGRVLRTGLIEGIEAEGRALDMPDGSQDPVVYPKCYESDMNGAGLLYFARYVAMMNYAERQFFQKRLSPAVSHGFTVHLTTEERKIFYFSNAPHHDSVRIHLSARAVIPSPGTAAPPSPDFVCPLVFLFRHDLYRESDGELMASSLVKKRLLVPRRRKGVLAEAERFKARHDKARPAAQ
jgi:probable biosynthetic protein (TIGR04098 family)